MNFPVMYWDPFREERKMELEVKEVFLVALSLAVRPGRPDARALPEPSEHGRTTDGRSTIVSGERDGREGHRAAF